MVRLESYEAAMAEWLIATQTQFWTLLLTFFWVAVGGIVVSVLLSAWKDHRDGR